MKLEIHQIIRDEVEFLDFIHWLPELGDNEKFYLSLFARKKYAPDLVDSNDRTQLKRFTSNKGRLTEKISQLEIPIGRYKLKNRIAPQKSLVLYIHPGPRDMIKATKVMGKKCWDLINNNHFNPHAECMSCIQKSKAIRHKLVTFDIDSKEVDLEILNKYLSHDSYSIIETIGGYHVIVHTPSAYNESEGIKEWYPAIKKEFGELVDNIGDLMSPVPGTTQGGFIPRMIKYGKVNN